MTWLKLTAATLVFVFGVFSFMGCNTIRGMGKDIQKGGQALEEAAR
ncbi:MAG TPA: entericidin A/B family lipoprotein [Candidatus Hydrogenedentes bacterium]|jgi:predicted small secreted protein|nr:entericidin A/B family lipoprotein [Candidatus Hydrogenedentota bacterium]HPJ98400.1 entericidin A/B family lipoprotein [Candidatus Hydrogenedentota bacterium]